MRARVEKSACAGCGVCADVCPVVFETGTDDVAQVKIDPVPLEAQESCRAAAEQCPTSAIVIEED